MAITYFCTDSKGNTYTRHSARENVQRYFFAVVRRYDGQPATKSQVSYHSHLMVAQSQYAYWLRAKNPARQGEGEVVEVRCYPGRHKTEPTDTDERSTIQEIVGKTIKRVVEDETFFTIEFKGGGHIAVGRRAVFDKNGDFFREVE